MSTQPYIGTELELFGNARNWKSYYASILRPYLRGRVLEVGAGIGETTAILCDGRQDSWLCLEPDARLSARVEKKIASGELPSCCTAQTGSIADVESKFDAILYIDVLEHIRDDRAELKLAAGRLRTGGSLIILAPAHQWLFSPFDAAIGHFRRYTKDTLMMAAESEKELETVRCFYIDSVGLLASMGNRYVLHKSAPNEKQIGLWDKVMIPVSRRIDMLFGYKLGKSVIAIWRKK